jgi:hypothetical protein
MVGVPALILFVVASVSLLFVPYKVIYQLPARSQNVRLTQNPIEYVLPEIAL